jgi:cytochrome P450
MQQASELDLAHLAMETPAFAADPFAQFAAARARHPWLAKAAFGYVITEYAAVKELLAMDDQLRTGHGGVAEIMGAKGSEWGRFLVEQILGRSGADHRRMRDLLAPLFTPRVANRHRPLMQATIARLLDDWAPKGAFDFEEFASYFPITVMCSLIGAPPETIPRLRSSLEALGLALCLDPAHLPAMERAMETMNAFVDELVAERRARGPADGEPDLLDLLIEGNREGGLTDRELADLLIFLFVAGYDTSKNVLTLTLRLLLDRPEAYARCATDKAFCVQVLEESLRFNNTATIPREASQDLVYRDVRFPAGSMLFFPVSVITRDPSAIPDAESFRPERRHDNRHMAFGRGAHLCLGRYIALAQIEEGLHLIAQRLTQPKLAGEPGWRPFPGTWGVHGLPITFTPAPWPQPHSPATADA